MGRMTLAEAIACKITFGPLGYPDTAKQRVLVEADKVISEEAHKAASRIEDGLCPTCWGDGFHRTSPGVLTGPCRVCEGTGHRDHRKEARDGTE